MRGAWPICLIGAWCGIEMRFGMTCQKEQVLSRFCRPPRFALHAPLNHFKYYHDEGVPLRPRANPLAHRPRHHSRLRRHLRQEVQRGLLALVVRPLRY